jgi:hypothetical protein
MQTVHTKSPLGTMPYLTKAAMRREHLNALADALLPYLQETGARELLEAWNAFLAKGGGLAWIAFRGGRMLIQDHHLPDVLPYLTRRWSALAAS